jgi:hypothetical protein
LPRTIDGRALSKPARCGKKGVVMKRALLYALLAALVGGCVVVPYGYRDDDDYRHHHGYYGYEHRGYPGNYGYRYYDHGS